MLGHIFNYETSRKFRSFLSKYGISLRFSANTRPVDFTDQPGIDPIAAIYQAGGRPVLLKVPLKDCIFFSHLAFPCTPDSPSPQIQTLIEYGKGNINSWEESPLVDFYNNFQPKNAAEMMGVYEIQGGGELKPDDAFFPWENLTLEKLRREREKVSKSDSMQYKMPMDSVSNQFFGPVSKLRCQIEWERYTQVYNSIASDGLFVDFQGTNNIESLVLTKTNQYKYLIVAGQHRIAALVALGKSDVILQIRQRCLGGIVDINHSNKWPTVTRGYLSIGEAEDIFSRLFSAVQPVCYKE